MAIKGKTKTKSGGRPVARAPRLAPVEVKPPFFARTRVKIALGILGGIAVSALTVWVWVGLRSEHRHNAAAAQLAKEKAIVASYQGTIDGIVAQVGTTSGPTATLFTDVTTPLSDLVKGKLDSGLSSTLKTAESNDKAALRNVSGIDISAQFGDKGFNKATINLAFNSQSKMKEALELYQQVFSLMREASVAKGTQVTSLATDAQNIKTTADSLFSQGYTDYANLKSAVGIVQVPQGLGGGGGGLPGLPGGS